ncbi:immunoglobulin-like domain-containing protein [Clostridium novyi]|uniref:immunoglobulin-like domain-containing protein n=1 Tax=Clostridium novyi TaxID=1542 RepID=UPI0006921A22|nr:immunoglobulin-like domain-containing protein [Clostridium novyi]
MLKLLRNNLNIGDLTNVKDNLILPTESSNGVKISWKSDDEVTIKSDGTVTRPSSVSKDKNVKLVATLTKGAETSTKEFQAVVKAKEKVEDSVNKDIINKEVSISSLKKDTQGNYIANNSQEFYYVVKDALMNLDNEWYNLDATWDNPVSDRVVKPGEKNQSDNMLPVLHTYFNISDDVFNRDHKRGNFEERNYPKCTATKYSYNNLNIQEQTSDGLTIEKLVSIKELDSKILDALKSKKPKVVLRVKKLNMNIKDLGKEVNKVCMDNKINTLDNFSYGLSGDYLTYKFTFK